MWSINLIYYEKNYSYIKSCPSSRCITQRILFVCIFAKSLITQLALRWNITFTCAKHIEKSTTNPEKCPRGRNTPWKPSWLITSRLVEKIASINQSQRPRGKKWSMRGPSADVYTSIHIPLYYSCSQHT